MKVVLTIWILAVLIQEVIPSTLVRLPRNAEKNLSLVHTEYEAKYEQKGKHGNESFSTVSGKQEIVHDNCAENWNSFAEKCASLIKDLVASLANAVSSKPGDATNLQLHIKNTFRHFDNTHNCTCFNHTGKSLSDLNLTPFFKNFTINTVGPSAQTSIKNYPEAKRKQCGGKDQPCDRNHDSDMKEDKNIMLENPVSSDLGHDKNDQPLDELFDGNDDDILQTRKDPKIFRGKPAEEQKQPNRALVDTEDLDMHPENAESSSDQSTNNSRRQINYPQNLIKPQEVFENSGDTDFNPFVDDSKLSSSNPKLPEGNKNIRYPFLVTPGPNFQSAKHLESPSVALNPIYPSGSSLESDLPNPPDSEPSSILLPQESSSAPTAVPPHSPAVKSNNEPSSISHPLNTNPNNNYLNVPQVVTEPHSLSYNKEIPEDEVPGVPGIYQKPIMSPVKPMTSRNDQPQLIDYHNPEIEIPVKSTGSESDPQSVRMFPEKGVADSPVLNPVFIPAEQVENGHKLVPLVIQSEKPGINSVSDRQPIPGHPLFGNYSSDTETPLPTEAVESELNTQSPMILPEQLPVIKSSEEPTAMHLGKPEIANYKSHPAKMTPTDYKSIINSPQMIPTSAPVENDQSAALSQELGLSKTMESELPASIPENSVGDDHNSESPLFIQNKKPIEELAKEILPLTIPTKYDSDKISDQGKTKPAFIMNVAEEGDKILKELPSVIPVINSNKKLPPELERDAVTIHPSLIYEPLPKSSSWNPLSDSIIKGKNPTVLSPEDILPVGTDGQPLFEEQTFAPLPNERDQISEDDSDHMIPMTKSVPTVPEVSNQQSRNSAPVEEQFGDKPNQAIVPDSLKSSQFYPVTSESTPPQKLSFNSQYPREEIVSDPMGKFQYPQQLNQEEMFTTPVPIYPEKIVTIFPVADYQINSQPPMFDRSSEGHESKGKDFTETEMPGTSNTSPSASDIKNHAVIGEQNNPPIATSEITATTPLIIYPVKSLPIPLEQKSPEQSRIENDHPTLVNTDFSDGNQEPELQEASFATPVPNYPLKPTQMEPQNSNADNPIQQTLTTEDRLMSDSGNEPEHPVTYAPVKESDIVQYPQVVVKPDKIPGQFAQPNPSDRSLSENDWNSVPSATIPPISPESHRETAIPTTSLTSAQSDILTQEEGQNPLLLQPTTFQTTSEDPTPSQVNVPGLLSHTTSIPQDSDETTPSNSLKIPNIHEHDDDDEEDCCSCESCTEEEITDPKQYKENACKNLEEARKELKAIFDKIKKKLKCGRKAPQTITAS